MSVDPEVNYTAKEFLAIFEEFDPGEPILGFCGCWADCGPFDTKWGLRVSHWRANGQRKLQPFQKWLAPKKIKNVFGQFLTLLECNGICNLVIALHRYILNYCVNSLEMSRF